MSVEGDMVAALSSLVGGRVYPDVAQSGAALPWITYQQVGGDAVNFVDMATIPSKKNARFQVNVWAKARLEAANLARLVEDTLRGAALLQVTVLGAPVAIFEPDTGLYGTRQDFSVWF